MTPPGNPFRLRAQLAERERMLRSVATLLDAIGVGVRFEGVGLPEVCRQTAALIRRKLDPDIGKTPSRLAR
jgi:hypothetical protein